MTRLRTPALLLGATALTLPLAFTPVAAQQQQEVGAEGACEQLYQLVQQSEAAGEELLEEFQQAPQVAEANEAEACVLMIETVDTTGGISAQAQERRQGAQVITGQETQQETGVKTESETFTATDTVRQTVEIEQQAIVEGQVLVRQPIPEVNIEQPGPQVDVAPGAVNVAIDQQPAEIMINQPAATVRVQIPQPTITIDQPAPEIVITMPPPGVSLDQQQPQVSVNMPEPTVTVSQADPEVTADVQARFVGAEEAAQLQQQGTGPLVTTQTARLDPAGNEVDASQQAEVVVRRGEPQVMVQAATQQGEVRFQPADPQVTYQPAEPQVEVTFAEDAQIQVQQVGQPTVRIVREGEQQGAVQGQQQTEQQAAAQPQQPAVDQQPVAEAQQQPVVEGQAQAPATDATVVAVQEQEPQVERTARLTPEDTNRFLGVEQDLGVPGELMMVTAADLDGRDVLTLRGEDVGEVEGVFRSGGQLFAVIEHGGFLGIGDTEVAIPLERIGMRGDDVVLLGLTEEQLEQLPEYDFDRDEQVLGTDPVEIGRYE